ncbi:uncharacterized protein LOC121705112 [Alosa sapidissima]|uniref:uncharacterized protein LOC121705112 n=1 Tax=Alosa sapidissima TaxID=34773 RepID=UPI001C0A51F5|nr:uncharacterized protein LOC121705112 [Alosa sapidissima]
METNPPASSPTPPEREREKHTPTQLPQRHPHIAVLIDSNGKFLDEQRLFPGRKAAKIWCPKIQDTFQIFSNTDFGTPSHIIIHTGTNDLRQHQERVGSMLCTVAERATEAFPDSRIIISTLLPRKAFHPDTISKVNADIIRGCAQLPNIHLAHHTAITPHHLYDHVHLCKNTVGVFTKALKDATLGRTTQVKGQFTPPLRPDQRAAPPRPDQRTPPPRSNQPTTHSSSDKRTAHPRPEQRAAPPRSDLLTPPPSSDQHSSSFRYQHHTQLRPNRPTIPLQARSTHPTRSTNTPPPTPIYRKYAAFVPANFILSAQLC